MPFDSSDYVATSTFWFTLSLLNAGLAQSKNRSGFYWWLASLFVGPIATLLLVTFPPGGEGQVGGYVITWKQAALGATAINVIILAWLGLSMMVTQGS